MLDRDNHRIIQPKPEGSQETGGGPALTPWQLMAAVNREDSTNNLVREPV
jgi:hypothetical protein